MDDCNGDDFDEAERTVYAIEAGCAFNSFYERLCKPPFLNPADIVPLALKTCKQYSLRTADSRRLARQANRCVGARAMVQSIEQKFGVKADGEIEDGKGAWEYVYEKKTKNVASVQSYGCAMGVQLRRWRCPAAAGEAEPLFGRSVTALRLPPAEALLYANKHPSAHTALWFRTRNSRQLDACVGTEDDEYFSPQFLAGTFGHALKRRYVSVESMPIREYSNHVTNHEIGHVIQHLADYRGCFLETFAELFALGRWCSLQEDAEGLRMGALVEDSLALDLRRVNRERPRTETAALTRLVQEAKTNLEHLLETFDEADEDTYYTAGGRQFLSAVAFTILNNSSSDAPRALSYLNSDLFPV